MNMLLSSSDGYCILLVITVSTIHSISSVGTHYSIRIQSIVGLKLYQGVFSVCAKPPISSATTYIVAKGFEELLEFFDLVFGAVTHSFVLVALFEVFVDFAITIVFEVVTYPNLNS